MQTRLTATIASLMVIFCFPACSKSTAEEKPIVSTAVDHEDVPTALPVHYSSTPRKEAPKNPAVNPENMQTFWVINPDGAYATCQSDSCSVDDVTVGGSFRGVDIGGYILFFFKDAIYAADWLDVTDAPWETARWQENMDNTGYTTLGEALKDLTGVKNAQEYDFYALADEIIELDTMIKKPANKWSSNDISDAIRLFTDQKISEYTY